MLCVNVNDSISVNSDDKVGGKMQSHIADMSASKAFKNLLKLTVALPCGFLTLPFELCPQK